MKNIIVAYPIKNTAFQIKNVLEGEGLYVSHICATGASVLNIASDMHGGVIVCASILRDMGAGTLAERLPAGFDIVALSKGGRQTYMGNYISLPIPLDKEELISVVSVLVASTSTFTNRKKDEEDYISNAKAVLMELNGMSEMQAHKYLQTKSMNSGRKLVDVAKELLGDLR